MVMPVGEEVAEEVENEEPEADGERTHDDEGNDAEEEAEVQRPLRDPGTPTKQEYADLMKVLKVNIASVEKQIADAIKEATADSYETLPGSKEKLEQLTALVQEAKQVLGQGAMVSMLSQILWLLIEPIHLFIQVPLIGSVEEHAVHPIAARLLGPFMGKRIL